MALSRNVGAFSSGDRRNGWSFAASFNKAWYGAVARLYFAPTQPMEELLQKGEVSTRV